jgi:hypothetical protein
MRTHETPSKTAITDKPARLGHFPPASQAGRLAGPVFYTIYFLWIILYLGVLATYPETPGPACDRLRVLYDCGTSRKYNRT